MQIYETWAVCDFFFCRSRDLCQGQIEICELDTRNMRNISTIFDIPLSLFVLYLLTKSLNRRGPTTQIAGHMHSKI